MGCNSSVQVAASNITDVQPPNSSLVKEEDNLEKCKSIENGKHDEISYDDNLNEPIKREILTTEVQTGSSFHIERENSIVNEKINGGLRTSTREKSFLQDDENPKNCRESVKREKSSVDIKPLQESIESSKQIEREVSKASMKTEKQNSEIIDDPNKNKDIKKQKRKKSPKLEQEISKENTEPSIVIEPYFDEPVKREKSLIIENIQTKSNENIEIIPENLMLLEKLELNTQITTESLVKDEPECKTTLEIKENKLNQIDREKSLLKIQISSTDNFKLIKTVETLTENISNSLFQKIPQEREIGNQLKLDETKIETKFSKQDNQEEIIKDPNTIELNPDLELNKKTVEEHCVNFKEENDQTILENQKNDCIQLDENNLILKQNDIEKKEYQEINTTETELKPQKTEIEQDFKLNETVNDDQLKLVELEEMNCLK
jgi:hypothetical protein